VPVVRRIPSIGAVASSGAYLTIVGFCLACYQAWRAGRGALFLAWVGATCAFPVFTILTVGFIGYGAVAAMMVLSFALFHYRPRWLGVLGLMLLGYIALSVYVTYMRDRDELREVVWGGESYSARTAKLKEIFTQFEFFQLGNERQLQAIDGHHPLCSRVDSLASRTRSCAADCLAKQTRGRRRWQDRERVHWHRFC